MSTARKLHTRSVSPAAIAGVRCRHFLTPPLPQSAQAPLTPGADLRVASKNYGTPGTRPVADAARFHVYTRYWRDGRSPPHAGASPGSAIDLALTAPGHDHTGWRYARGLRLRPGLLLTCLTIGSVREAGKQLGGPFGSGRFDGCGCGLATTAKPPRHNNQQQEENSRNEKACQVGLHHQPLH